MRERASVLRRWHGWRRQTRLALVDRKRNTGSSTWPTLRRPLPATAPSHHACLLFHLCSLPSPPPLPSPPVAAVSSSFAETPASHKGPKPFDRYGESLRIKNQLVSTVHALIAVVEVVAWFSYYEFEPFNWRRNMQGGFATPNNENGDEWALYGISITLGYFIYDTICMAYYHKHLGNTGSYIHHIAIGSAFVTGACFGSARIYQFLFLLEELSTPALNLKSLYRDSPRAYSIWSAIFAITFYLSRGIYGMIGAATTYWCLFTFYFELRAEYNSAYFGVLVFIQFLMFTISNLLNAYWMVLITRILYRKIVPSKSSKKVKKAE